MKNTSIKETVVKAVDEFNKYRIPESTPRLISVDKKSFKIEFIGFFCCTCGFYDYFDDYKVFLEEIGLKTKITGIREIDERAIVKFTIEEI